MQIKILGSESLGVRGLCCFIAVANRKILIDPGIALGYMRHKLLPHPLQVEIGNQIKKVILSHWEIATDIVLSHFHGDHVPLAEANVYQMHISDVIGLNPKVRIWTKPENSLSCLEKKRAEDLLALLDADFLFGANGDDILNFSKPFPHGDIGKKESVIMTRIASPEKVFVHSSDIQLLADEAINQILDWSPDVALIDGPPLYLGRLSPAQISRAWKNAVLLACEIPVLILDHHLMRDGKGLKWLDRLSGIASKKVMCSADFMQASRFLMEADRDRLYKQAPVPENWHKKYEQRA